MDLQLVDKLAEFGEYENAKRKRDRTCRHIYKCNTYVNITHKIVNTYVN